MSKRGENIYKRKDGRWEGRYKVSESNTKTKYISVYGQSYAEVKKKLLLCKQKTDCCVCNMSEYNLTMEKILLSWLEAHRCNIKISSYIRYHSLIYQHLLPGLGSVGFGQLTAQKIINFMQQQRQKGRLDNNGGLSAKTVSDMLCIIKSAVKMAAANYSLANAASILEIKSPVFRQKDIKTFSDDELQIITRHILQNSTPTNMAVLFCLNTGLRLGEICALRWTDIDFKSQTLSVKQCVQRLTRNGKSQLLVQTPKSEASKRILPLTSEIILMLKSMKKDQLQEYVFGSNKPLDPRSMQYRFVTLLKKCDISQRNFHVLRHTFASRFIALGGDIKSLSEILGHANVRITMQLYVHPSLAQKRSYMENISTLNIIKHNCA